VEALTVFVLTLVGFTACAEFGSYAFVHPVVRRLPPAQMIVFEQGLLRTFGRTYPVLMPLGGLALIGHALWGDAGGGPASLRWIAVLAWLIATLTTLIVNVPINNATSRWDAYSPPPEWRALRHRWDVFQAVRAWLLLMAFITLCLGFALG
jgi:uncharacterized membrane protein